MEAIGSLIRPVTLTEGAEYLRLEHPENGNKPTPTLVRFIGYTACPAFVIVSDSSGRRGRCLREELFSHQSHTESRT